MHQRHLRIADGPDEVHHMVVGRVEITPLDIATGRRRPAPPRWRSFGANVGFLALRSGEPHGQEVPVVSSVRLHTLEHTMKLAPLSLLTAVALLAVAPASAAPAVVTSFNEAAMDKILATVGATAIEKITVGTDPGRNFTVDGLNYTTALRGCKDGSCPAILIQCIFDGETFATSTTNKFNLSQVFATSAVSEDRKSLFLGRLTVALGGTTVENAVEGFKIFFAMPAMLREQVQKEGPVVAAPSTTTPVATTGAATAVATAPGASVSATAAGSGPNIWVVEGARANTMAR